MSKDVLLITNIADKIGRNEKRSLILQNDKW